MVAGSGGGEPGPLRLAAHVARDSGGAGVWAYGGVYIGVALLWLWTVDGIRPTAWDVAGVAVALTGMGLIMFQPP